MAAQRSGDGGVTAHAGMRITIRAGRHLPLPLMQLTRRRLEYALGCFSSRVRSVTVRLADVNGPRGGVDKKCAVAVRLDRPKRLIVIEDIDADPAIAIDRAADRVARAVVRAVQAGDGLANDQTGVLRRP